jgi:hypothetical protein
MTFLSQLTFLALVLSIAPVSFLTPVPFLTAVYSLAPTLPSSGFFSIDTLSVLSLFHQPLNIFLAMLAGFDGQTKPLPSFMSSRLSCHPYLTTLVSLSFCHNACCHDVRRNG